jgi:hypothetical protein
MSLVTIKIMSIENNTSSYRGMCQNFFFHFVWISQPNLTQWRIEPKIFREHTPKFQTKANPIGFSKLELYRSLA